MGLISRQKLEQRTEKNGTFFFKNGKERNVPNGKERSAQPCLEVASDVAVEFQSFMLGLELVPWHLDMLKKEVRSVLTQQLEVDMLPYMSELGARNIDDAKSLRLVRVVIQISRAGYAVEYMLPELYRPFELVQISVLPFSLTDNGQMVRFKLESELQ